MLKNMILQNKEYAKIGKRLIKSEFPELCEYKVKIAWLESDEEKMKTGKTVLQIVGW